MMENSALRRRLLAAVLGAIVLCSVVPGTSQALDYPWCVASASGYVDCSYTTFAQCQAAASGTGACFQNPRAVQR